MRNITGNCTLEEPGVDNGMTKTNLTAVMYACVALIQLVQGPAAGCSEHVIKIRFHKRQGIY